MAVVAVPAARSFDSRKTLAHILVYSCLPACRDSQLVNIKYRSTLEKKFWQVGGPAASQPRGPLLLAALGRCPACLPARLPWHAVSPGVPMLRVCLLLPMLPPPPPLPLPLPPHLRLVNVARRRLQVKGAEKVLFGLDDIVGVSDMIVVEGEMDKLALEEAGYTNVVSVSTCLLLGGEHCRWAVHQAACKAACCASVNACAPGESSQSSPMPRCPAPPLLQVPDGAPARVREGEVPPADQDTKFSYLWNCRAWLDQASKVVIATGEPRVRWTWLSWRQPGHCLVELMWRWHQSALTPHPCLPLPFDPGPCRQRRPRGCPCGGACSAAGAGAVLAGALAAE